MSNPVSLATDILTDTIGMYCMFDGSLRILTIIDLTSNRLSKCIWGSLGSGRLRFTKMLALALVSIRTQFKILRQSTP